jgi:hypothetical protein
MKKHSQKGKERQNQKNSLKNRGQPENSFPADRAGNGCFSEIKIHELF